jgi:dopamine beta-monooxygenase
LHRSQKCYFQRPIAGWAVGGEPFYYPANAGYRMSGTKGTQFILMEVHYDNPTQRSDIVDGSGMTFVYTSKLRQFDAGLVFFARLQETIIIPSGQTNFPIEAHCSSGCTANWPKEGINVIASFLHAHTTGSCLAALVSFGCFRQSFKPCVLLLQAPRSTRT